MDNVFSFCVDLLVNIAYILGISYEELNVILFCIINPIVILFLIYKAYFSKRRKFIAK